MHKTRIMLPQSDLLSLDEVSDDNKTEWRIQLERYNHSSA